MSSNKIICPNCNKKIATWCYMPGYIDRSSPYRCDDCVHRGCSCNYKTVDNSDIFTEEEQKDKEPNFPEGIEGKDWEWVEEDEGKKITWQYLDVEYGKPFPCCEYFYDKDGWNIDDYEETKE